MKVDQTIIAEPRVKQSERLRFGDSKVVDAQGQPLVVYHGTTADFKSFSFKHTQNIGFHFGTAEAA